MKKLSLLSFVFVLMATLWSCNDKKPKAIMDKTAGNIASQSVKDSTIYGTMVDGGMNSLILLTDKGDTLEFLANPDDTTEVVKGGKINGDRFAVIGYTEYGDRFLRSAINLTSLQGKWTSLDKDFTIKEDGTITSNIQTEQDAWSTWKIVNGRLVLSKDTFTVNVLGADTLSLENNNGIFVFRRGK